MSGVDNSSDLIKKYSRLFYRKSGRGGCFFVVDDIIKFDKNDVVTYTDIDRHIYGN